MYARWTRICMQLQAQKFGVVKGSYRATPLPRLKTFQASLHLRAAPLNATRELLRTFSTALILMEWILALQSL